MPFIYQKGAVWVEFLVTASTVLLALFFLIPLLGKYIDVRHTTENAARYSAWERTVWHGNKIKKSVKEIENESMLRVMGDPNALITSGQKQDVALNAFESDTLHHFSNSKTGKYEELLSNGNNPNKYLTLTENETSGPGFNQVNKGLDALGVLLEGGVPVERDGYFKENVAIVAKTPTWIGEKRNLEGNSVFTKKELNFYASNSILVDGWGAGGKSDNASRVRDMKAKGQELLLGGAINLMKPVFSPFYPWSKELWMIDVKKVDTEQLLNGENPNDPTSQLGKYK